MLSENPAYLFAWNSKPEEFNNYVPCLKKIERKGMCRLSWRCNTTKIRPGDRVFLMKLGKYPKGIFGSGKALSTPADGGIDLQLDILLDVGQAIFDIAHLQKGPLAQQNWTPQSNGISIKPRVLPDLVKKWNTFLSKQPRIQQTYLEGAASQVIQTRYERDLQARIACLNYYGFSCTVCNFNFEKQYGEIGKSFIHVHHIRAISSIGKEYRVNPVEDLRPVCPNCHAMLHKQHPQLSIDELKMLLSKTFVFGK